MIAKEKSAAIACYLQMLSYTPSSSEQKTSYLMQYLVSNTNMESVSLQTEKIKKKDYRVYIYMTNVKGFFLFMCESCESKILCFVFLFTVSVLFISCSVKRCLAESCDLPCSCELCACVYACVWDVCRSVSLKQYEW